MRKYCLGGRNDKIIKFKNKKDYEWWLAEKENTLKIIKKFIYQPRASGEEIPFRYPHNNELEIDYGEVTAKVIQ